MLKFEFDVIDLSSFVQQLALKTLFDFSAKRDKSDWRVNNVTITIPEEKIEDLLAFLIVEYDDTLDLEDLNALHLINE